MSAFSSQNYRPPSLLDLLIGWVFGLLATAIVVRLAVAMLMPLLPWIAAIIVTILVVRWQVRRRSVWR